MQLQCTQIHWTIARKRFHICSCFSSQCEKILATGNEFGYVVSSLYFSQILNLPPTNLSKSSQTFDFHGHFLVLNNLTNNPLESIWKLYNFCYQNCSDLLWEKNCSSDWEKTFENWDWRPRICKHFEITRTIYSNSERSEQFLVTECFFNLFLEVSHT